MRESVSVGPSMAVYVVYAPTRNQWLAHVNVLIGEGDVWTSDYREAAHFNSKQLAKSETREITSIPCLIFKRVGETH